MRVEIDSIRDIDIDIDVNIDIGTDIDIIFLIREQRSN
jgi:hypothetical protein